MSRIEDVYPLSPMQEGMLFHTLLTPESGVYLTQVNFAFAADELDLPLFERSWQRVLDRHAALRTFFAWEDLETPIQAVEQDVELPVERLDWRHLPAAEASERLAGYKRAERTSPFELTRAPLMRLGLIRVPGRCEVVWTFHHLILDGWSVDLVLQEVREVYRCLTAGREPQLPNVRPFRDYVVWLQRRDLAAAERHWREELRGFTSPTMLPGDGTARPAAGARERYAAQEVRLRAGVAAAAAAWARRGGLTPSMLAQGVWSILLSRYSDQVDVACGVAVLGRPAELEGVESMVGLFVNTLVLRTEAPAHAPLLPWLQQLQASWTRSRRFEHSALVEVQGWSEVPRGKPLFETVVSFLRAQAAGRQQGEGGAADPPAGAREVETLIQTSVALTLQVSAEPDLVLRLSYDRERCGDALVGRLLGHAATLFAELPGEAGRRLSDLPMLGAAERQQVVLEWNDTAVPQPLAPGTEPAAACLHELFAARARQTPDAVALVCERAAVSFGTLARGAHRLTLALRGQGVTRGARVGLCCARGPAMIEAMLGVLACGAAYVPIDPAYPRDRLAMLLADSAIEVLVGEPHLVAALPPWPGRVILLDRDALATPPAGAPAPTAAATPDDVAYVIYTSGSTGRPKGVEVTHRNVASLLRSTSARFGFDPSDVWTLFHSYAFDFSVWEIWGALLHGARLVIVPYEVSRSPQQFAELLAGEQVTVLNQTPSAFRQLVGVLADLPPAALPPLVLRWVIFGGEALEPALLAPWIARHGDERPGLVNMFGITETTVHVTFRRLRRTELALASVIGQPIAGWSVLLLDRALQPVPAGLPGEIHVGGQGLARGYLERPELTAERFVPHPFAAVPGERLYRSGDLARWRPDGDLEYLGRLDQQVKIRGFRIEPGEIEAALLAHPEVRGALVVAQGSGAEARLIAYVEAPPQLTPQELLRSLRGTLPEHMVPAVFMVLDRLPLTPSGKLDRGALPPPEARRQAAVEREPAAPRDALEGELVAIWEEILRIRPIGVHDDFFTLGGHSLLAVRLMSTLNQRFGRQLEIAAIVEARTIARLASLLRRPVAPARWSPLVPLQPRGTRPPFFCIHPIGGHVLCYAELARHLGPDQPVYGLQAPGLEQVGAVAPPIEEMAASYLAAVREMRPAGPYLVGGWSMGGILAFELARQLGAAGEEAALVAILDAWSPLIHRRVPDDAYLLAEIVEDQALQKGMASPVSYEQLRELAPEPRLRCVLEEGRQAGLVAAAVDVSWLRLLIQGYRARREALKRYRPAPYAGRLTLFRAAAADSELLRQIATDAGMDVGDPTLGWGAYSTETVAVAVVPGNHSTMCMEPNVQALAGSLSAWINSSPEARPGPLTVHPTRFAPPPGAPTARPEDSL